ncbi:hypothetical protein AAVH_04182 [Aphelenchoides avenae]|nr:hypothetical protein AAVH_04182 [Aphelenchus avenae]
MSLQGLWRGQPLHFEINQTPSSDPRYEIFRFEDEQFRSVVDLIEFYHNHRRRVTESSGFVLCTPVINEQKLLGGQLRERNNNEAEAFQIEIEAAYAEYNGRSSENRFQRTLSQQALLNSARRRVPGGDYKSEQDLMKAALSLTENFSCDADYPNTAKLASAADRDEDYSEVDYAAMDDLGDLGSHVNSSFAHFGLVPKPVTPKRHSELLDRHNLIKPSAHNVTQFGTSRSSSNLNRIHASTSQDSSVPPPHYPLETTVQLECLADIVFNGSEQQQQR